MHIPKLVTTRMYAHLSPRWAYLSIFVGVERTASSYNQIQLTYVYANKQPSFEYVHVYAYEH